MARGRSGANRGWRSKMQDYIDNNPSVLKQAYQIQLDSLKARSGEVAEVQAEIDSRITALEQSIAAIDAPTPSA